MGEQEDTGNCQGATHEKPPYPALTNILAISNLATVNLKELQSKAGAAETLLKAVANQHRLIILCELLKGERSVTALRNAIGLSQSALSQHLARLREDDLVATRRESQTIYYSLASSRVTRLIGLLYELYCAPECDADRPAKRRRKTS
ncbi:MAG: ArsR/SmtB family transcription factor [Hyphomicrobiales bacterium]